MKRLLVAALAVIHLACGHQAGWAPPADPNRITDPIVVSGDVATLVEGNTAFATALHQQLSTQSGNLFYSPYSISLNMSELDSTGDQSPSFASAMGFTLPPARLNPAFDSLDLALTSITGKTESGDGQQFQEASAAWGTLAGPESRTNTLEQFYGAEILSGNDPGAAIQAWQSSTSPGPQLPTPLIGACDGFLVTLVNFNAAWQTAFDPTLTQLGPFTRPDGSSVEVPFMNQVATLAVETTGTPAIEIPYDGNGLSMVVVLPTDLASFEASLSPEVLSSILAALQPRDVRLSLPRFSFTNSWSVLPTLEAMGLPLNPGNWQVFHSAEIQVSETGTQATAVTTTSHSPSAAVAPVPFLVNQPFFFFIRDQSSGTILFIGRITDPTNPGS